MTSRKDRREFLAVQRVRRTIIQRLKTIQLFKTMSTSWISFRIHSFVLSTSVSFLPSASLILMPYTSYLFSFFLHHSLSYLNLFSAILQEAYKRSGQNLRISPNLLEQLGAMARLFDLRRGTALPGPLWQELAMPGLGSLVFRFNHNHHHGGSGTDFEDLFDMLPVALFCCSCRRGVVNMFLLLS